MIDFIRLNRQGISELADQIGMWTDHDVTTESFQQWKKEFVDLVSVNMAPVATERLQQLLHQIFEIV